MWTRSAANKITGKFSVTCTDWNGAQFFKGEFDTAQEADRAGEDAEYRMTIAMQAGPSTASKSDLTDDEILAGL